MIVTEECMVMAQISPITTQPRFLPDQILMQDKKLQEHGSWTKDQRLQNY